jgi:hypothetical protein
MLMMRSFLFFPAMTDHSVEPKIEFADHKVANFTIPHPRIGQETDDRLFAQVSRRLNDARHFGLGQDILDHAPWFARSTDFNGNSSLFCIVLDCDRGVNYVAVRIVAGVHPQDVLLDFGWLWSKFTHPTQRYAEASRISIDGIPANPMVNDQVLLVLLNHILELRVIHGISTCGISSFRLPPRQWKDRQV